MFIISIGLPKSGSTLFSLYQRECVMKAYPENGQDEFERLIIEGQINGVGHFMQDFNSPVEIKKLLHISNQKGPFVIKTHSPATDALVSLIRSKHAIATIIHRDPRDAMLSAIDHGKRISDRPGDKFFQQFRTVEDTIPMIRNMCHITLNWLNSDLAEVYKYKELLLNPQEEISRFCHLINKSLDVKIIEEIIFKYTSHPEAGINQFNTGKVSRYLHEMTSEEINLCTLKLQAEIKSMGYQL